MINVLVLCEKPLSTTLESAGLKAVEVAVAAYESSDRREPVLIKSNL